MAGLDYYANEAELPSGTLAELFLEAIDRQGDRDAFRYFGGDSGNLVGVSYPEVYARVMVSVPPPAL